MACGASQISNEDRYIYEDQFSLPSYDVSKDESIGLSLWATYYYLPQYKNGSGTFALRDIEGNEIGPTLSLNEWCTSALEGSVRITEANGQVSTYNYAGVSEIHTVDCKSQFRFDVSRSKFKKSPTPFGEGIKGYHLIPFRTIATDPQYIPTGSVIYVPSARGAEIEISPGIKIIHDGYFFAGDVGGAIKQNHIDVFLGTKNTSTFFPWISNKPEQPFRAFIIKDEKIINEITQNHLSIKL